jgi:hypothetical protein
MIAIGAVVFAEIAFADTPSLSTYGTLGLVEIPTAQSLEDGNFAVTVSASGQSLRTTATFQVLPRLSGSFRYAGIDDWSEDGGGTYDRSFDLQYSVFEGSDRFPAVSVGLRDFFGTGVYSGEYIVATSELLPDVTVTGGVGWGRFSGSNSIGNPLAFLGFSGSERQGLFEGGDGFTGAGGQLESGRWFKGPASLFGGVHWQATEKLSFQIEYSDDDYDIEERFDGINIGSPINAALEYKTDYGVNLKAYAIGGQNFGGQISFVLDPKEPSIAGGREPAPLPIVPRSSLAAASWNVDNSSSTEGVLRQRLANEGVRLDGFLMEAGSSTVFVDNERWDVEAQAAGRIARVLANTLPPSVEQLTVVFQDRGLPLSSVTTMRRDLEELQFDYDGAWRTRARADISDGAQAGVASSRLLYDLSPYTAVSLFDPQKPIRADVGVQLDVGYQTVPGLNFDATLRYPLAGNLGGTDRESDSVIQRVRSDSNVFARESDLEVNQLTAEYLWRPAQDTFARVTGGYLENQFGGISAETLWSPIHSRLALGVELNYVKQRDFDMLLGFQDYDVVTGHMSAYYDLGNGFQTQVDLGRYLAGDWGGTVSIDREFNNGVKVGGYFTLTDVSFDEFGEGSFDKGLRVEVPLSFITGQPSRRVLGRTFQPVLRDGGARLNVDNRLNQLVRDYRGAKLEDGWGTYLR